MSETPRWEGLENAVVDQLSGVAENLYAFDGAVPLLEFVPKKFPAIVVAWQGAAWTASQATEGWIKSEGRGRIFVLIFTESGAGTGEARRGENGGYALSDAVIARLHGFDLPVPDSALRFTGPLTLDDESNPESVGMNVRIGILFSVGVFQSQARPARVMP